MMSLNADSLLDRIRLKRQLHRWRIVSVAVALSFALYLFADFSGSAVLGKNYIARVHIDGIIQDNQDRLKAISEIAENKHIKAVVLHVNSPGGTVVGGEALYESLKSLSREKPVVVVMGTLATSAAYMISLPVDHVFARKGTITGSIGVLLQNAEFVEMAKKLGIELDVIKTSELKGVPSPLEKTTPEARRVMQGVIDNFQDVFMKMVAEGRKLSRPEVEKLADGRVFTGLQALENKLIDGIGGEKEALAWLYENKKVSSSLEVEDVDLLKDKRKFGSLVSSLFGGSFSLSEIFSLQGLLSVWQDGIITH